MRLIKTAIINSVVFIYRRIFIRKVAFRLNHLLFELSANGLGVLNHQNNKVSGEDFFLKQISAILNNAVVLDVGAHIGNYANKVRSLSISATIYACEPHPKTFQQLEYQACQKNYLALNLACSDTEGKLNLYDYSGEQSASQHASLYQDVITVLHQGSAQSWEVNVKTVDQLIERYEIESIRLLKIDTEGNELKVLLGAKQAISKNLVDIIQFEFNEMNVVSRVFFKDFYDLLKNYAFFRLLPDGLIPLGEYNPFICEIFAYQNIIAINRKYLPIVRDYLDV
ncbi:MAG: FkbM family methyltransferase [Tildeniella nuda ZEHNDER 1965/U140]|jgi:FkbM family methyltransferase|nr:FkbM family methyltransferase [Tildeniella nuda ZEHNDER 1965/U140]